MPVQQSVDLLCYRLPLGVRLSVGGGSGKHNEVVVLAHIKVFLMVCANRSALMQIVSRVQWKKRLCAWELFGITYLVRCKKGTLCIQAEYIVL